MMGVPEFIGGFGGRVVRAFALAKGLGEKAQAQSVPVWQRQRGIEAPPQAFSDQQRYVTSDDVYAAINALARKAARVPWQVALDGEVDAESELALLLNRANGELGGYAFWLRTYTQLWLTGDVFIVIERDNPVDATIPNSLWPVPGRMVKPRVDKATGRVIDYLLEDPDTQETIGVLPPEDVVPLQLPNPSNPFHGQSPLTTLRLGLDAEHWAKVANRNIFYNGMMIDGILWFENDGMRQEQIDQLKGRVEATKVGATHAHQLLWLATKGHFDQMQLTPADVQFLELDKATTRDVCKVLGIPPTWLADFERATYENVAEADRQGWENGVMPIVHLVAGALTVRLAPQFDEDAEVRPDVSAVPALQADQKVQAETALLMVNAGADPLWALRRVFGEAEVPDEAVRTAPVQPAPPPAPRLMQQEEVPDGETMPQKALGDRAAALRRARDAQVRASVATVDEALRREAAAMIATLRDGFDALYLGLVGKADLGAGAAAAIAALADRMTVDGRKRGFLAAAVRAILASGMVAGADGTRRQFGLSGGAAVADLARQYADLHAASAVTAVTDDDRLALRRAIADALEGTETKAEALELAVQNVNRHMLGIESPFGAGYGARVERIAMTEVGRAWNAGAVEAMRQSGVAEHRWVYSGKPTSRHSALHGTTRPLGQTWDVNGYPGLYPGDPNLPAGETINCECIVVPVGV